VQKKEEKFMNNNNFKTIMIVAVIALIAFVGVGYAAFQRELKINGEGTVKSSSWKIKFANLSEANLTGKAEEITKPTISNNDTHIGNYAVNLTAPGDSMYYTFDVVNAGTFDAEISSITLNKPSCAGNGANGTTDATNVCANLTYKLTYADGTEVAQGNTLNAGETKNMKLALTYSSTVTEDKLPKDDVTISNLEITIIYAQK